MGFKSTFPLIMGVSSLLLIGAAADEDQLASPTVSRFTWNATSRSSHRRPVQRLERLVLSSSNTLVSQPIHRSALNLAQDRCGPWITAAIKSASQDFAGVLGEEISGEADEDHIFVSKLLPPGATEANIWFFGDRDVAPLFWCIYLSDADPTLATEGFIRLKQAIAGSVPAGWNFCELDGAGEVRRRSFFSQGAVAGRAICVELLLIEETITGRCGLSLQIGVDGGA